MPGVLDIKWRPDLVNGSPVFGLVNSVGVAELYLVTNSEETDVGSIEVKVTKLTGVSLGEEVLGLSLDWSNRVSKRLVGEEECSLKITCTCILICSLCGEIMN